VVPSKLCGSARAEQVGKPAEILFPSTLLRRAARCINGAADLAKHLLGERPDCGHSTLPQVQ